MNSSTRGTAGGWPWISTIVFVITIGFVGFIVGVTAVVSAKDVRLHRDETARITACVQSGGDWTTVPNSDTTGTGLKMGCLHK